MNAIKKGRSKMKNKPKERLSLKEKLGVVVVILAIAGTVWTAFSHLGRYALCATLDKQVERIDKQMDRIDKQMEMMKEIQKKEIEKIDQKTEQQKVLFKFELNALELKQVSEQIESIERIYGTPPKDHVKRADLERLKRKREELLIEKAKLMDKMEKK